MFKFIKNLIKIVVVSFACLIIGIIGGALMGDMFTNNTSVNNEIVRANEEYETNKQILKEKQKDILEIEEDIIDIKSEISKLQNYIDEKENFIETMEQSLNGV